MLKVGFCLKVLTPEFSDNNQALRLLRDGMAIADFFDNDTLTISR